MGTPDLARTVLDRLYNSDNEVLLAISQPDKQKDRGHAVKMSPVKEYALEKGIEVFTPDTLKNGELKPYLEKYQPDAIIVAAYGKILPEYVINFGGYGCINVHGSLLPKYRGAAPIQRAIMAGEKKTGITIMKMDEGLDTGDMISKGEVEIKDSDNFETVHDALAELGADLLIRTLSDIENGTASYEKQDDSLSNYAKKITKEDCLIDFNSDARALWYILRGLSPIPLGFAFLRGKMVKFIDVGYEEKSYDKAPGTVVSLDGGEIKIACGSGCIVLRKLLPEGKKRQNASDFINGRQIAVGDIFRKER